MNKWHWAISAFVFLLTPTNLTVHAFEQDENIKLPVSINIHLLETGNIVLEITNSTNKEQRLTSNLEQILDSVFGGFPTKGALQFRDARGVQISFRGQHPDGWGYPSIYSSSAEKSEIGKMTDITIQKEQVLRYPIECGIVLRSAMLNSISKRNEPVKEFRVRLPLELSVESGKAFSVNVISGWFPIPDNL